MSYIFPNSSTGADRAPGLRKFARWIHFKFDTAPPDQSTLHLIAGYANPNGKHYPLAFRRFRARDWAHTRLMTIGECCRTIARATLAWSIEQSRQRMALSEIKLHLVLP